MTDESMEPEITGDEHRMVAALRGMNQDVLAQLLNAPFNHEHLAYQMRAAWLINRHAKFDRFPRKVVVAAQRALERAGYSTNPAVPEPAFTDEPEEDAGQQLLHHLELLAGTTLDERQN